MIRDTSTFEEYPFHGVFYRISVDESAPLTEREERKEIILETECDIEENRHSDGGGFISAAFKIFFPFDKDKGISIRRGDFFEGSIYGLKVEGQIAGVFPTSLGGCEVYLRDFDS